MSSMVSRRPPFSVSVSHSKERRWMSIRLGTSRVLFRRANERRVRGTSTRGKTATPQGVGTDEEGGAFIAGQSATSQFSTAPCCALPRAFGAHGPRPANPRMWRGRRAAGRLRLLAEARSVAVAARRLHSVAIPLCLGALACDDEHAL